MTGADEHWNAVYEKRSSREVSWYREHLETSLAFIDAARFAASARVLDVGAGASTLVDDLLQRGFTDVEIFDLSERAIARVRERLRACDDDGPSAVRFSVGNVLTHSFDQAAVDLWHDRAVLHFLTDDADREVYRRQLMGALARGGHVILGGFANDGPEKCSGLPVRRSSAEDLFAFLGEGFEPLNTAREAHVTPWGSSQSFVYVHARLRT